MAKLSAGYVLDRAAEWFQLDVTGGVQLWEAGALLAAARPAGLPMPGEAVKVAAYAETQGLGVYAPPAAPFPLTPTAHGLVFGTSAADWPALAALLLTRYPVDHQVRLALLTEDGSASAVLALPVTELASTVPVHASFGILSLPPLARDLRGLDGLRWVVARLLGPGGCPWDVVQTHRSLRAALLEEAYEVLEALDAGDMVGLAEELGDLLISVVSHSEMARQAGAFTLEDVLEQVSAKLIGRHPHVFGALQVEGEGAVLANWEQMKAAELAAKGRSRTSALDGVPPGLPALAAAQKLTKKATRAGFSWAEIHQVWAKLREELDELAAAAASGDREHSREELGDVLFVIADLARWMDLDAEIALREANDKFRRRFAYVEATAGGPLAELSLDELLALWSQAKDRV